MDVAPRYVCISDHDRAVLDFFYNEPEAAGEIAAAMEATTNCGLVYANPDMGGNIREGPG